MQDTEPISRWGRVDMANQQKRQVIAVVTDAFAPFHREVVDGLQPHFSAAGFGTLAVTERDVRSDRETEAAGLTPHGRYDSLLDVQGAVVVCGATPPGMSAEAIAKYVSNLTDGPVVSLGIVLPGVASMTIGWDHAISELLDHMVSDPRRQRFVFVRGYAGDPHSRLREAGFRTGMAKAGLEVDEQLIVYGNYSVADSLNAIDALLKDGQSFDGLIAANDDMATGAIAALTGHGLRVPQDVIVAGFDDSFAAFTSVPPLTTVQLDTPRLTKVTANVLLHAIATNEPPPADLEHQIESKLILRASSRLPVMERKADRDQNNTDRTQHLRNRLLERWETTRAPKGLDADELARAAVGTLLTGDPSIFELVREPIESALRSADVASVAWLRHAARELQGLVIELHPEEAPAAGIRAILEMLTRIDRRMLPIEKLIATRRTSHRQIQERLVMRLASCADTDSLWATLRSGLVGLGMTHAWVAINDEHRSDHTGEPTVRLLFSLDGDFSNVVEHFPRFRVLPERFGELLEHDTHVLVPLRTRDTDIGYLVVEPRSEYLLDFEAIASGIAQVLLHLDQVADLEHQTARLRRANQALDHLARRDSLTGLANRKLFLERLEAEIKTVDANERLSVLFLDLDGFKQVNDTLGHETGDHFLRILADRVEALLLESETLARLGGDEFTILIRSAVGSTRDEDIARAVLEAIVSPCQVLGETIKVSASLGVATYPEDGRDTAELLRNADAAMYLAKGKGKNQWVRHRGNGGGNAAQNDVTTAPTAGHPAQLPTSVLD